MPSRALLANIVLLILVTELYGLRGHLDLFEIRLTRARCLLGTPGVLPRLDVKRRLFTTGLSDTNEDSMFRLFVVDHRSDSIS